MFASRLTKYRLRYIIVVMLKQGLTNYFKSLKYFFTPLGTMFLGIMLGLSVFIPGVISSASVMVDSIGALAQNVNLDFDVLLDNVWSAVRSLNWNEQPVESVQTMLSAEWLNGVLTQSLNTILGTDYETFVVEIADIVNSFLQTVTVNVAVFFVFWVLGFIAGFALIRFLIRRNIARRSLWKFILAYFLNSLLTAVFVIAGVFVFALWKYSVIIMVVLALVLIGILALVQAYLLYACKKIKFSSIVNLKNVGLYTLTNLIIFAISICVTLVAVAVNNLMGIFVGLGFVTIANIVIDLNAESYVMEQVKNNTSLIGVLDERLNQT